MNNSAAGRGVQPIQTRGSSGNIGTDDDGGGGMLYMEVWNFYLLFVMGFGASDET